jgi:hypothetical protein
MGVPSEDAIKPQLWELIERAAELVGDNRRDFILDRPIVRLHAIDFNGGRGRTRTCDLLRVKQAL